MTEFSSIFETLHFYMGFPFVRYALIVGVLIALCSSLFGVTLVLKRYSFIGDGLSHVAFGAMAVATIFNLASDTVLIMPVTVIAAILLLRTGQNTKIKGDAAIGVPVEKSRVLAPVRHWVVWENSLFAVEEFAHPFERSDARTLAPVVGAGGLDVGHTFADASRLVKLLHAPKSRQGAAEREEIGTCE